MMLLSTLAKVKKHIGIPAGTTTKDELLDVILTGVSSFLARQTNRTFELTSHDLKMETDGTDTLMLPQYPILKDGADPVITTLELNGVSILAEVESGAIDIDAESGILYRPSGWTRGTGRNLHIVFTAGYAMPGESAESGQEDAQQLPEDLELAAIRMTARIYERRTAEGVQNVSAVGFNATYRDAVDEDIQATIDAASRVRVG